MSILSQATLLEIIAALLFALAIVHTFATKFFERLAARYPAHAGIYHLLGEVEVVFGFWALVFLLCMFALQGQTSATEYIDNCNFTEPLFVFAIMVIAGTRPILYAAAHLVQTSSRLLSRTLRLPNNLSYFWITLVIVPLLGSCITEPAAMTLAALILRDRYFTQGISQRLQYATLGVLFVNISIGGTLTHFAAPPVLMVAAKWQWDSLFMLTHFGWKAILAVCLNSSVLSLLFYRELRQLAAPQTQTSDNSTIPYGLIVTHLGFLIGVVVFAHHPPIFIGLLLFFLGITHAYQRYQTRLILREGLLVAFFLAGLVVLGGQQQWWLQPLLLSMSSDVVFIGATALTAITDNAALTYLGSLVEGLSAEFKYALVAGAVAGGGLTIIANAPNPAGSAILREHFSDKAISPLGLLLYALPPTLVAMLAFKLL